MDGLTLHDEPDIIKLKHAYLYCSAEELFQGA